VEPYLYALLEVTGTNLHVYLVNIQLLSETRAGVGGKRSVAFSIYQKLVGVDKIQ